MATETQTRARSAAHAIGGQTLAAAGPRPVRDGALEPGRAGADAQAAARRGEGEFTDLGPSSRHGAAHRPLAERQVRGARARHREGRGLGEGQPADLAGALRRAARRRAGVPRRRDELFVQDLYCGAEEYHRLSVRYVTPSAWHMAFVRNMFIRPEPSELARFDAELHGAARARVRGHAGAHGTRTGTFIVLNLAERTSSSAAPATPAS
jgi:hypothetical protein